jgi:hypothetical protein
MNGIYRRSGEAPRAKLGIVALLAALAACVASSPKVAAPDHARPPPEVHEPADASYDWHGLLVAPFGSLLKDIALPLHEVLVFKDEARGGADSDDAECYAVDAPAPRFVGRAPNEYLLCFKHDRLARVEASVRLTADRAAQVLADACALWLKNAQPQASADATQIVAVPATGVPVAGAPATEAPTAGTQHAESRITATQDTGACEGRDGAVRFSSRLAPEPGQAETPLSITLDSVPERQ